MREADEPREAEEEQRNTLACFASRSAALDLAGVPAKIEHRGQRKKGFTGTRCRLGMELGIIRAHAREYRAALAVTRIQVT